MLNKLRSKEILILTLPVLGGMMSQNLLNLVDMYMVGRLGPTAVAAVGITSYTNWLLAAAFLGLSAGVQALASRRIGEGRNEVAAHPLNGSLLMIAMTAIPLAIVLILCAPWIVSFLTDDPDVAKEGIPYLQARIAGIAAMGMNFSFRAYWSATKLTRFYFMTLIVMHTFNIGINYVLIFGHFGMPALGTFGAGLGTTISLYFGTLMYVWYAHKHTQQYGFLSHLPSRHDMLAILRVSVPASLQQVFFALGYTALFWIVGRVGTGEMAIANVLINVTLVAILPCIAFGISAATLVGQSLGRNDASDAHAWGWDVAKLASITAFALAIPMFIFAPQIIHAYITDPAIADIGIAPLRLVAFGLGLDAIGLVLLNAMQGAGATRVTMLVTLGFQWLIFLPAAYWLGPVAGMGLFAIWIAQFIYRAVQFSVFIYLWQKRQWATIKL